MTHSGPAHAHAPRTRRLLPLLALLAACSSGGGSGPGLTVDRNPDVDFGAYETFDFTRQGNVEGLAGDVLAQMESAVARAMTSRGYRKVSSDPDLLLEAFGAFEGRMEEEVVRQHYPSYFQREQEHTFTRTDTVVTHWEDGTLALQVLDAASGVMVWSVRAQGAIQMSGNPDVMQERLNQGAENLLADFPAR